MNRLFELASILKDVILQDNSEVNVFKGFMELPVLSGHPEETRRRKKV